MNKYILRVQSNILLFITLELTFLPINYFNNGLITLSPTQPEL